MSLTQGARDPVRGADTEHRLAGAHGDVADGHCHFGPTETPSQRRASISASFAGCCRVWAKNGLSSKAVASTTSNVKSSICAKWPRMLVPAAAARHLRAMARAGHAHGGLAGRSGSAAAVVAHAVLRVVDVVGVGRPVLLLDAPVVVRTFARGSEAYGPSPVVVVPRQFGRLRLSVEQFGLTRVLECAKNSQNLGRGLLD